MEGIYSIYIYIWKVYTVYIYIYIYGRYIKYIHNHIIHTDLNQLCTYVCAPVMYVNLDFKGKQGNEPERPLFYFHRKKAAQVGLEPMTSCFQGSHSTN